MMRVGSKPGGKRAPIPGARRGIYIVCQVQGPRPRTKYSRGRQPGVFRFVLCVRAEMNRRNLNLVLRILNWCIRTSLPASRRAWGEALIAEQQYINNGRERLMWSIGGLSMGAREFARTLFGGGSAWAAGGALSLTAALIDLHSATRWPYGISMFMIAFILSCLQPKWVWRWVFFSVRGLPGFVLGSFDLGPLRVKRLGGF